jgi:hypothetical protein
VTNTSDKVGAVASIVLAIIAAIIVLWPRAKKKKAAPAPSSPNAIGAANVNAKGQPAPGSPVATDGSPRLAVGLTNVEIEEAPPPAPAKVLFSDPGKPPEII